MQIMQPEKRELATVPIPPVRRGMDSRAPMSQQDVEENVRKRTTNEENRVSIHHNKSSIHLPSPLYVTTFHCAASAKDCERRNKRTDRAP